MSIGKRLEKAMLVAGHKSQKSLEVASGVPQATISRILNDRGTKGPETDTLLKLAEACRTPFEWLLNGPEDLNAEVTPIGKPPVDPDKELDEVLALIKIFRSLQPKARVMLLQSARDILSINSRRASKPSVEEQ